MSTEAQMMATAAGAGDRTNLYRDWNKLVPITMVAGATTQASIRIPAGSIIRAVLVDTLTAFTGTPTNINLTVGTAAAGAQIVAATDVKAQGHVTGTIVAAFDNINYAATADQTVYFQIAAVGGTNPAGTVYVRFSYGTTQPA